MLFPGEALADGTISKVSTVYQSFGKRNSINSSRYNERLFIYYLFCLLLFPKGFLALLFATLNRSLQFNSSTSELYSSFFSSSTFSTLAFAAVVFFGAGVLRAGRGWRTPCWRSGPAFGPSGRRAGRSSQ